LQLFKSRNARWNHAHHNRACTTLHKNVYTKSGLPRHAIRKIARSLALELLLGLFISGYQIAGNSLCVVGRERRQIADLYS
jgi:hypothetical protein